MLQQLKAVTLKQVKENREFFVFKKQRKRERVEISCGRHFLFLFFLFCRIFRISQWPSNNEKRKGKNKKNYWNWLIEFQEIKEIASCFFVDFR